MDQETCDMKTSTPARPRATSKDPMSAAVPMDVTMAKRSMVCLSSVLSRFRRNPVRSFPAEAMTKMTKPWGPSCAFSLMPCILLLTNLVALGLSWAGVRLVLSWVVEVPSHHYLPERPCGMNLPIGMSWVHCSGVDGADLHF